MVRILWQPVVVAATLVTWSVGALTSPASAGAVTAPARAWTIQDLVGIRWITQLAVDADGQRVAFIVKHSSVQSDTIIYELHLLMLDGREGGTTRKLAESSYLADIASHPGTQRWTVRGDFGHGTQLYDIGDAGDQEPLAESSQLAPIGGNTGVVRSASEPAQPTGILGYQWAPDGSALWYTRLRLRSAAELQQMHDQGLIYDSDTMFSFVFARPSNPLLGVELRLLSAGTHTDRLLSFAQAPELEPPPFSGDSTRWSSDSKRIEFMLTGVKDKGERAFERWNVQVETGENTRMPATVSASEAVSGIPAPDGAGLITVRGVGDDRHLVRLGGDGALQQDYGQVNFSIAYGARLWQNKEGTRAYLPVHYRDRDGLVAFPPAAPFGRGLTRITDTLSQCALIADFSRAICVRESLTRAPEVIELTPDTGRTIVLARPNASYDSIIPLKSEHRIWINRYGIRGEGYVTYPRNFVAGQAYPTIVVTHGHDAQNMFAYAGFQWDHPIQLFAEAGYLVLSVNDPITDARTRAAEDAFLTGAGGVSVDDMQFYKNVSPVASMEAALQWAIDAGYADRHRAGIAGYSRGCEVVEYALAHSRMFKAGSDGDAGGWNPGAYWAAGTSVYRALYRAMYGGSAYDPQARANYEKYAPAFRAADFAGPLLQQFAMASGVLGLELHSLLREANVPAELILYPDETHLFWGPRHRAAVMTTDLDWFNFWLKGKANADPERKAQLDRWEQMQSQWKLTAQTTLKH